MSRLCQVRIGDGVRIGEGEMNITKEIKFRWKESGFVGRNQVSLERIRFRWKESGFVGRNQVPLEGIRFRWKESGFVGRNQVSLVVL